MLKMWLMLAGFALWIIPVLAYRYSRRSIPSHVCCITGTALGLVASPASMGTYAFYWIFGPFGLIATPLVMLGIVGLALSLIHGEPGFFLATALGLRGTREVVHGI